MTSSGFDVPRALWPIYPISAGGSHAWRHGSLSSAATEPERPDRSGGTGTTPICTQQTSGRATPPAGVTYRDDGSGASPPNAERETEALRSAARLVDGQPEHTSLLPAHRLRRLLHRGPPADDHTRRRTRRPCLPDPRRPLRGPAHRGPHPPRARGRRLVPYPGWDMSDWLRTLPRLGRLPNLPYPPRHGVAAREGRTPPPPQPHRPGSACPSLIPPGARDAPTSWSWPTRTPSSPANRRPAPAPRPNWRGCGTTGPGRAAER